uniref:EF-hand domain-containing protein n=1 Tax=Alexandrium monilatum TaxID=311494 RepID=A0A7S4PZW8_9DINO
MGRRVIIPGVLALLLLHGAAKYGQAWFYAKAPSPGAVHAAQTTAALAAARGGLPPTSLGGRNDGRASSRVTLQQQRSPTSRTYRVDRGITSGLVIDTPGASYGRLEQYDQTADDRKLASAIQSIARDQENMRMSTPLASPKMMIAGATAVALATIASASLALPLYAALIPAITSGLFIQTAGGESSGTRSRGLARHNSGQAVALACQQESILAAAETRKAFLPFGVGLTAIFAAACVTLKLFNEKIGDFIPEDKINPPLLAADNLLEVFFAVAAVVGCAYTVEEYLRMNVALTLRPEDKKPGQEEELDWEVVQLPKEARELQDDERNLALLLTSIACLLPLPFFFAGFDFAELFAANKAGNAFNKEFQEFVDSAAVIVSATAGAQAAIVFLIGELQFTDAERRVAQQAKQAALSELFFAQSQAEFAAMPAKSALTGAFLAGTAMCVEFAAWAAAILPWPAVFSTMRQFFSAKLTRSSSDATFIERRIQTTGRRSPRKQDALSSTTRELQRLYSELFQKDTFSERIKESLLQLPVGAQRDFKMLNSESRRKVHFVAAELGMVSQSDGVKRSVRVTNFGGGNTEDEGLQQEVFDTIVTSLGRAGATVARAAARGVPRDDALLPAAVATTAGAVAPFALGEASADLLVPLLTGGIGLATVWQERVGKFSVAEAKQKTARVRMRCSKAESLFGRAMLAMSALPTYLAIGTCATTVSVLCFMEEVGPWIRWSTVPLLLITIAVTGLTAQRQKGIQFYIKQAAQTVEGRVPPQCWVKGRRWWIIPTAIAVAMPLDLPRRLTIACAVLATEIGIMMSSSFTQLAVAEFYAARAQRVWARSDAWAQEASTDSRALPLNSAVAVINTLLATALIAFDTPLGAVFPVVGFAVCYQALQSRTDADLNSEKSQIEAAEIQAIGTEAPPFLERAAATENLSREERIPSTSAVRYVSVKSNMMDDVLPNISAKLTAEGRNVDELFEALSQGSEEVTWPTFREFFMKFDEKLTLSQIERLWLGFDQNLDGGISRQELASILGKSKKQRDRWSMRELRMSFARNVRKFMKLFDEKKADDYYAASAAERAVEGVQASLSELRLSVRRGEKDWVRTGAVVGVSTTAALLAPFVLSELLTEVLLPLVGAVLTVFAVGAEADARRTIAGSKVWAAELNEIASTQEELLAVGGLYKAKLLALTALSVAIGITAIAVEEPFSFLLVFPQLKFAQTLMQVGLVVFQAVLAAWVTGRLLTVMEWTKRVRQKVTASMGYTDEETPRTWFRGKRRGIGGFKRLLTLCAMFPSIWLAIHPLGSHFAKRAVASTAAGALVVASMLYFAEYMTSRAELAQAARMRTFAMADAFVNSAEQQGAILPLVSAASIAFAGLITFLTEVNPFYASGLTVLQALAWLVASRKAVAAKFESEAALKVNLRSMSPRIDVGQDPVRQIKRMVLN